MKQPLNTNFNDRITNAQEAKKAMLAKFKPKPMVTAAEPVDREALRQAELESVRAERAAKKEEARLAREAAELLARQQQVDAELAAMMDKRNMRKERKAMEKASAQQKRAARFGQLLGS